MNNQAGGDPVCGTRMPEFGTVGQLDIILGLPQYVDSPTLELHGPKEEWVGHICFNDNHVETLSTFYAPLTNYERRDGFQVRNDNIAACEFDDGPDDASDPNESSGDAWMTISIGADADGDQIDDIYDPLDF